MKNKVVKLSDGTEWEFMGKLWHRLNDVHEAKTTTPYVLNKDGLTTEDHRNIADILKPIEKYDTMEVVGT